MFYHLLYDYLLHNKMALLSHHIISNMHLCEYWQQKHSLKSCKKYKEYIPLYKKTNKNKL